MLLIQTKSKKGIRFQKSRRPVESRVSPRPAQTRTSFPADAWNAWHERQTI